MFKQILIVVALVFFIGLSLFYCTAENGEAVVAASGDYADLLSLFEEFREFENQRDSGGALGDISAAMEKMYHELKTFQSRLEAIDPSGWPVSPSKSTITWYGLK